MANEEATDSVTEGLPTSGLDDLLDTARDLLRARSHAEVLARIAKRIRSALTKNTSAVYVLDPSIGGMRAAATDGTYAEELRGEIVRFGNGILGTIASGERGEIVADTAKDERGIQVPGTPATDSGEKLIAMPLRSFGATIGVMAVWRGNDEAEFVPEDLRYLEAIAALAVIAIENARGYEEQRLRIERLSILAEIGRALATAHEQTTLIETVYRQVARVFDVTNFFVVTYVEGERQYEFAFKTEHGRRVPPSRRDASKGLTGYVLKTRAPLLLRNPDEKVAFLARSGVVSFGESLMSWMGVPLLAGDRIVGVMVVQSYETANLYDGQDLEFFALIGTEVAIAIQNARLFEASRDARREAEAANHQKSAFLAKMSHELRTPLNAIINFAYLLNMRVEGDLNPGQSEMIGRVEEAGRHLLGLINDVLDLAKIESGRMELAIEEVELAPVVEESISTAAVLVSGRPIRLELAPSGPRPRVRIDRVRIRQVLLNLLSNAAKFTESGSITVRIAEADGGDAVEISVSDTGRGIAEEDLAKVFDEFVQVGKPVASQGTGLGLPISRHFVEMHGGRLTAESEVGRGTTFRFTLPLKRPEGADGADGRLTGVLAIDDDPKGLDFIASCLSRERYRVMSLSDPRLSLQETLRLMPDVVILDIGSPGADYWGVLRALKDDERTRKVPVVACAVAGEAGRAYLFQADDFVPKPFDPERLRATIAKFAGTGATVLAIDDDPDSLEIVRRTLYPAGLKTIASRSGADGLSMARALHPDVVVLDLMMPGMSGFEVLDELKADPALARIPVVIVTAKDLTQGEREQLVERANALLTKGSFKPEELERTVERLLGERS